MGIPNPMTWVQIGEILSHGTTEEVLHLKSSRGERLFVKFTAGRKLALNIRAIGSDTRLHLDGLEEIPPWVAQIGEEFETQD